MYLLLIYHILYRTNVQATIYSWAGVVFIISSERKEGVFMSKRISVTSESSTGRNMTFHDNYTGSNMSRIQFVNSIKSGKYENYHIRNINGVDTPVSNPDRSTNNNLG